MKPDFADQHVQQNFEPNGDTCLLSCDQWAGAHDVKYYGIPGGTTMILLSHRLSLGEKNTKCRGIVDPRVILS